MIKSVVKANIAATGVMVSLAFLGTVSLAAEAEPICDAAGVGQDSFCQVGELRINYIDWGGEGPTIILLTGLGNSAHIFDEFGPMLRDGHRVIAITRRAYGASDTPTNGDYSNAAMINDVLGVMDGLDIARASFVGHSIAGGELAGLGLRHPERVERLVYLDSAYDRSRALQLMAALPTMPLPSAADRANLDALTAWRAEALQTRQFKAVRNDLAAIMMESTVGLIPKVDPAAAAAILEGDIAATPQWEKVAAPSLAFFSSKDVADQVPPNATPEQRKAFINASVTHLRPWMLAAKEEFEAKAPCGVPIEVPNSTHHFFLERPKWAARAILDFLSTDRPCRWSPDYPAR